MLKLFLRISTVILLSGCAMSSPIERAEAICNRLGDPSPACKERQFNIERTREDTFRAERHKSFEAGLAPSQPQPPQESQYDKLLRESKDTIKQDCANKGGKYEESASSASCDLQ